MYQCTLLVAAIHKVIIVIRVNCLNCMVVLFGIDRVGSKYSGFTVIRTFSQIKELLSLSSLSVNINYRAISVILY